MSNEYIRNEYIRKDNEDSLLIYYTLLEAFKKCEKYASPYLNLVAIFSQDLMRILTGYVLKRNELEGPYVTPEQQMHLELKKMPYINYKDISKGIKIEEKNFSLRNFPVSNKKKIYSILSGLKNIIGNNHRRIALVQPSVNLKKILFKFIKSGYKADFPSFEKIYIPDIEPQLSEIKNSVEQIFNALSLPEDSKIMNDLLERHILSYCSSTETNGLNYSLVVAGTLLGINNRILAARAKSKGIPVISLFHGDWDGVLDEPVFGYGERSYADLFVGYGEDAPFAYQNGQYTETLYELPQHITTDSNIARCIYKGKLVEPLGNIENKRIMYVPTLCRQDNRYGPFRDMPLLFYKNWQEALIREFPGLIFKAHPNGIGLYSPPSGAAETMTQPFQECLNTADVFLFDYMSTAFSFAAATSKPIIYFNIGLRNFSKLGFEKIKKRCIWIDVDPAKPENLREMIDSFSDKECVNEFSESFSLRTGNDGLSREDVLFKTIIEATGSQVKL